MPTLPLSCSAPARRPAALACAAALLLGAFGARAGEKIGLGPLQLPRGEHPHGERLAAWLREGIAALPGVSSVELLAPGACAPDEGRCLAASARGLAADTFITARIELAERGYRFRLRSFRAATGADGRELAGQVSGGPLDLFGALEGGACKLLGKEPCAGDISITSDPGLAGTHVFVDGKDAGALPILRPVSAAIGRHEVRVAASQQRVRVSYGRTATLAIGLRGGAPEVAEYSAPAFASRSVTPLALQDVRAPSAEVRRLTANTLMASGLAVALAGAGVGLWAHVEGQRLDTRYRTGALVEADKPRYGQVHAGGVVATALIASGAGALACGGLLFALTPAGPTALGHF